ncbi:hypothetical protein MKZ38_009429 [Zalerion maritima]|uniref:Uncharacterized protein n=1 Tax=Zalerion maritima TaxID=339359 RepID=A0AAD5WNK3_9PEZI|nr:hypothetical protein MKZ38_009429 [Zalerion maritima]
MATVTPRMPDGKKLSFAKVAAAGTKDNISSRVANLAPVTKPPQEHSVPRPVIPLAPVPAAAAAAKSSKAAAAMASPPTSHPTAQSMHTPKMSKQQPYDGANQDGVDCIEVGMNHMVLEQKTPNLVVNGTSPTAVDRIGRGIFPHKDASGSSEDKTDSNSDLGTKPPSLDGKSVASGTTFALDEKESLRPDDSASMIAAAEDDDAFSTRGSILAGSRMGSENRVGRIQIGEMPLATRPIPTVYESQDPEATGQAGPSTQQAPVEPKMLLGAPDGTTDAINNALYGQNPDEKLLEAMNSPKDRLFLLRLEKEVIEFVQNSKEPFIDLPPCNSFCRLLTHKLADYYHMTHSYESSTSGAGSVRIFRTPFCRVPPSLASIAAVNPTGSTPPPAILPRKIMRRGEEGGTASTSANASKATSEVGSDGKEKSGSKERLTREEREEAYNRARERIFGTSETTGESTPENDDSNGMSRASSLSAKNKSAMGKRKLHKRGDDNEGFETRSQYAAYYGHPRQPWQPQYVPITGNMDSQYNPQMQPQAQQQQPPPVFNSQVPAGFMPNHGQFTGTPTSTGYQYGNMGVYNMPQGMQAPYPPQMNRSSGPVQPYAQPPMPAAPMPTTPQQSWQQSYMAAPGANYQQRPPVPPGSGPGGPGTSPSIPYAFGQLPVNVNPKDPKSQHPIPGSYSRQHAFNPKTQSFVPSASNMMPMAPQAYGQGPMHGSPQIQNAPVYTGYGQQFAGGFGMARQASGSGMPPGYPAAAVPAPMPPHPSHMPNKHQVPHGPAGPGSPTGNPSTNFSHLPNYGNPATLPQKPLNPGL